jgi:hypothetical protein
VASNPARFRTLNIEKLLGEPLWLSAKVMERVNKQNQKIPGSLPARATFKKIAKLFFET